MAEEAKASEATSAPSGGGNKIVTILTIVNLLACLGIGAVLFISHKKQNAQPQLGDLQASAPVDPHAAAAPTAGGGHGEKAEEKKPVAESLTMPLEQFTVNLATPGGTAQKFVRVNIALEVGTSEVEKEVQAKMPQVRNAIIDLFNSKRPNDLVSGEQREYLKEEIRNALNSFMNNGKVKGVYFTNFAVTG